MAKVFKYRGKTLGELQEMNIDEFAKLLPSKLKRHIKRGFTSAEKILLKDIRKHDGKGAIRTHVRSMIVLPEFVGKTFAIHNGKTFEFVEITEEMIAHRLGEFSKTRKRVTHSGPGIGATRGTKFTAVK